MMNEHALKRLEQEMTPQRFVLENGLTVLVCEMPQFKGVHAVYATRFGSATRSFELDGETVTLEALLAKKIIRKSFDGLKVLGDGELTKKLTVQATVFSAAALAAMNSATIEPIKKAQQCCMKRNRARASCTRR